MRNILEFLYFTEGRYTKNADNWIEISSGKKIDSDTIYNEYLNYKKDEEIKRLERSKSIKCEYSLSHVPKYTLENFYLDQKKKMTLNGDTSAIHYARLFVDGDWSLRIFNVEGDRFMTSKELEDSCEELFHKSVESYNPKSCNRNSLDIKVGEDLFIVDCSIFYKRDWKKDQ